LLTHVPQGDDWAVSDSTVGTGTPPSRSRKVGRVVLPFVAFVAYVALELPVLLATGLLTGTAGPVRFLLITGPTMVADSFVVAFVFYCLLARGTWKAMRIGISR
jgi:hypothetical protein